MTSVRSTPTEFSDTPDTRFERYRAGRDERFVLQRIAKRLSASPRISVCLAHAAGRSAEGTVKVHRGLTEEGNPIAGYSDVLRCGLAHLCPFCAAKVRETVADEINTLLSPFLRVGGHCAFVTLTIADEPGESIEETTAAVERCYSEFRRLLRARGHISDLGIVGDVSGWEFTVRLDSTGHPHRGTIFALTHRPRLAFHRAIAWCWHDAVERCGRRSTYTNGARVDVPELDDDGEIRVLASYVSKGGERWGAGDELARADRKISRSESTFAPFDLLRLFAETGDLSIRHPWRAYERAVKGKAVGRFSRGLRSYLQDVARTGRLDGTALPVESVAACEDSEERNAAAEEEAVVEDAPIESPVVVEFEPPAWSFIVRRRLEGVVLRIVEDLPPDADFLLAIRYLVDVEGASPREISAVGPPCPASH